MAEPDSFPRLDRNAFSVRGLHEENDEKQYWAQKTPQERLEALELMRQILYGYDPATTRLQELLQLLNAHQVEYLLIGGYAVGYHGYPRATVDMDIWIGRGPSTAAKMVEVLQEFGFDVPNLSAELFLKEDQIVRMGVPPVRLEIFTSIPGVEFGHCYSARVEGVMDGVKISLINLQDLKVNKKATGRHQDLDDLENLP